MLDPKSIAEIRLLAKGVAETNDLTLDDMAHPRGVRARWCRHFVETRGRIELLKQGGFVTRVEIGTAIDGSYNCQISREATPNEI